MTTNLGVLNRPAPDHITIDQSFMLIRADNPEGTDVGDIMSMTDQVPDGLFIVQVDAEDTVTVVYGPFVGVTPESLMGQLVRWPNSGQIDLLVHFSAGEPSPVIASAPPVPLTSQETT